MLLAAAFEEGALDAQVGQLAGDGDGLVVRLRGERGRAGGAGSSQFAALEFRKAHEVL